MSEPPGLTRRRSLALLAALPALPVELPAEELPREMVVRADALRQPLKEGLLVFRTTTQRENEAPVEATHEVRVKGRDRSVVLAVAGRDKGQRVLMNAENLWVRLPGSNRALRITPMQKLMGDVSYGDLGRLSWAEDYTAAFHPDRREERLDGVTAWVLRLVSRGASATYPQIDLWLAKSDSRPLQASFYLGSGKLLKSASFGPPETLDGRRVVAEVTYRDALNPKAHSVLHLQSLKVEPVPESLFSVHRFGE